MLRNEAILPDVASTDWKELFLDEISSLPGFDGLAAKSRERPVKGQENDSWEQIERPARELMGRYPRRTLVEARQHYNNVHLVEFWKWYYCKIQIYIAERSITQSFPVFLVKEPGLPEHIEIHALSPDYFDDYEFKVTSSLPPAYAYKFNPTARPRRISKRKFLEKENLDKFICRLSLLQNVYTKTTTSFYDQFLSLARRDSSPVWDDYRIHLFLDRFLYETADGQLCDAPFEKIFFSSNLCELAVYLRYQFERKFIPPIAQIGKFLSRQRKYYVELAMTLDMAGAAYLNNFRHLLHYHPQSGTVQIKEMEPQVRLMIDHDLVRSAGVINLNGCPFAKSKGTAKNAVIETFQHFDLLMMEMATHWYKFLRNGKPLG